MYKTPDTEAGNLAKEGTHLKHTLILLDTEQWSYLQKRYNLTPRERQIAELICQGLRNGSIAKYLCIKPDTVKTHTRNIYRKIHVKSKIVMLLKFVDKSRKASNQHQMTNSIPIAKQLKSIT